MTDFDKYTSEEILDFVQESISSDIEYLESKENNIMLASQISHEPISPPSAIIVFGCGGTGSWFIPKMIKVVNDAINKRDAIKKCLKHIILVDGDTVEDKNIIRQNFASFDVGLNKAEVMCNRYSQLLDSSVKMSYIPKFVSNSRFISISENKDDLFDISTLISKDSSIRENNKNLDLLVFNFIDNGLTRKIIHEASGLAGISRNKTGVSASVIDVANDEMNGQLDTSIYNEITERSPSVINSLFYIKNKDQMSDNSVLEMYSCADRDAEVNQMFSINELASSVASNYLNIYLSENCFKYSRYEFVSGKNMFVKGSSILEDIIKDSRIEARVDDAYYVALDLYMYSLERSLDEHAMNIGESSSLDEDDSSIAA